MSIANITLSGYTAGPAYFSEVNTNDGRKMNRATFKIVHNPRTSTKDAKGIFMRVTTWGIQAEISRDRVSDKSVFVTVTGDITAVENARGKDGELILDKDGNPIINFEISAKNIEIPRQEGVAAGGAGRSTSASSNQSWGQESPTQASPAAMELLHDNMDEQPF